MASNMFSLQPKFDQQDLRLIHDLILVETMKWLRGRNPDDLSDYEREIIRSKTHKALKDALIRMGKYRPNMDTELIAQIDSYLVNRKDNYSSNGLLQQYLHGHPFNGLAFNNEQTIGQQRTTRINESRRLTGNSLFPLQDQGSAYSNYQEYRTSRSTDVYSRESPVKLESFDNLTKIGRGGCGEVFKAKHLVDDLVYAIKVIPLDDDNRDTTLREVRTLSQLRTESVVRYYHSWIKDSRLFVQMELCSDNLKNILEYKPSMFGRDVSTESMHSLEYYITCRLFLEILQCVQSLHELKPPVIHRDLKPENILFDEQGINGKFIKLCDMGLSVLQDRSTMVTSRYNGTPRFRAPEIVSMQKYDWRADIYSLSVTAQELFELDVNGQTTQDVLEDKLRSLKIVLDRMHNESYKERPSCKEILDGCADWTIALSDFEIPENIINKQLPERPFVKFVYHHLNSN